ncbi:unknown [Roseburia sp. CAG:380]|nr:unknown [Roseburia sp. CAG:380]
MIIGILHLDTLIRDARIENVINTLADQPCDMTVCQFCRVTLRLAWNGFDTKLVDLAVGLRREDNAVTKLREEGKPERIVLVHIQDTRNTNGSSDGMLFIQRCVMLEESLVFIFKQVWNVILVLFLAETALATVSGDKLASAGKAVDRLAGKAVDR